MHTGVYIGIPLFWETLTPGFQCFHFACFIAQTRGDETTKSVLLGIAKGLWGVYAIPNTHVEV